MSDLFQDTKIIAAVFSAATALIIALTGAFAFFYRSQRDDIRNAKKVLFLLLEVRHAIKLKTLPIDEVAIEYCKYAANKINSFPSKAESISPGSFDISLIMSKLKDQLASVEENLAVTVIPILNEKLADLAEDDPVLAFKFVDEIIF